MHTQTNTDTNPPPPSASMAYFEELQTGEQTEVGEAGAKESLNGNKGTISQL